MKSQLPDRKKNRLENYDYSSCGAYFITICTAQRKNYFWKNVGATIGRPPAEAMETINLSSFGKIVDEAINNISEIYPSVMVDIYVIMPDHIHLLLLICADERGRPMVAPTMSRIVNQLKGHVTKRTGTPIWQKSFFDHIIRNREDYEEHLKYIYENPMRWYFKEENTKLNTSDISSGDQWSPLQPDVKG